MLLSGFERGLFVKRKGRVERVVEGGEVELFGLEEESWVGLEEGS